MNAYEQKKAELELRSFTASLQKPSSCRNAAEIRLYVAELSTKIAEHENQFNSVPSWIYALLAQYNHAYNRLVHTNFVNDYA